MSSGPTHPPIPPSVSAISGASAQAKIDQISVRIIAIPDAMRNRPSGSGTLRVDGVVNGQNPDGSVSVKTDQGVVILALKDKGTLPQGLHITVDIPAGRSAQQAMITVTNAQTNSPTNSPTSSPPITPSTPTVTVNPPPPESLPLPAPVPPSLPIESETLGSVLTTAQQAPESGTSVPIPVATGPLRPDQFVRLAPLHLQSVMPSVSPDPALPKSLLNALAPLVQSVVPDTPIPNGVPAGPTAPLVALLLRHLDTSFLTQIAPPIPEPPSSATAPSATPAPSSPVPTDMGNELITGTPPKMEPQILQQTLQKLATLAAPLAPASSRPPPPVFYPSQTVDAKILAFYTTSPAASLPSEALSDSPSAPLSVLPSALQISASLPDILPDAVPHAIPAPPAPPVSLGQVVGFTDTDLPIVALALPQTGWLAHYSLQFKPTNLEVGSSLFLILTPLNNAATSPLTSPLMLPAQGAAGTPPPLTPPLPSPLPSPLLSHSPQNPLAPPPLTSPLTALTPNAGPWDSLDDLLSALTHASPAQAQALAHMIPSPATPPTLAALSLFFLAMIRSGDSATWIGPQAAAMLRQMGKASPLQAVTADLALAAKYDQTPLLQDWRMTILPFLWDHHIQKIPLYYKHMPDDTDMAAEDERKRRRLRFLFDLSLSRMGDVQVDGFLQSERLDLILRTRTPLSPPMQHQMKRIYAGAMDKSRLTGDLSFQFKPDQWVNTADFATHSASCTGVHA